VACESCQTKSIVALLAAKGDANAQDVSRTKEHPVGTVDIRGHLRWDLSSGNREGGSIFYVHPHSRKMIGRVKRCKGRIDGLSAWQAILGGMQEGRAECRGE
jgi:hypothetical protein